MDDRKQQALMLASVALIGTLLLGCESKPKCRRPVGGTSAVSSSFAVLCGEIEHEVRCTREDASAPYRCVCSSGGTKGRTFERSEPLPGSLPDDEAERAMPDALRAMNAGCGWELQ